MPFFPYTVYQVLFHAVFPLLSFYLIDRLLFHAVFPLHMAFVSLPFFPYRFCFIAVFPSVPFVLSVYFISEFYQCILSMHYINRFLQCISSVHFISAFYQHILSVHFINTFYQCILAKHSKKCTAIHIIWRSFSVEPRGRLCGFRYIGALFYGPVRIAIEF